MSNEIRALYSKDTIRVYQAYNKIIASEAVMKGTFGNNFKMDRMTWIKPSFLWMMYRCGWATKENQECVLAIDIQRNAFDYLVANAVISTYQEEMYRSREEWKRLIHSSDIRLQWDPERDIHGNPLNYRSLQLVLSPIRCKTLLDGGRRRTKIYMVFLREPSRRDRSGSDLFHLRDGFEIKMNFDRNVSCFIFVNALMHDDFFD